MYLVITKNGNKICENANEVKSVNKGDVVTVYALAPVAYDSIISTSDIRDCVYDYLKEKQRSKEDVVDSVSIDLDVKKSEVSKVVTAMKKEGIIYVVNGTGEIGID